MEKKATLLTIIFVSVFFAGYLFAAGGRTYVPQVLISCKWGTGPGEFGLLEGKEVEPLGPVTFTLDNTGNIYILDSVNGRVEKFAPDGTYVGEIGRKLYGSSMCVSKDGKLYLLGGNSLKEYSPFGKLKKVLPLAKAMNLIEGYGQSVFFDQDGNLSIKNIDQRVYKIASMQNKTGRGMTSNGSLRALSKSQQMASKRLGMPGSRTGLRFVVKWRSPHRASVEVLAKGNRSGKGIELTTSDNLGSVLFLKQDGQGSIYVEVERITADDYVHLEVLKYDVEGFLLAKIELPNDYYTTCYKKVDVDSAGNVYQLLTLKRGVQVIKWHPQEK